MGETRKLRCCPIRLGVCPKFSPRSVLPATLRFVVLLGTFVVGIYFGAAESVNSRLREKVTLTEQARLEFEKALEQSKRTEAQLRAILAEALAEGDSEAAQIARQGITKAQQNQKRCDVGLTACKARIEELTGALKTGENMRETTGTIIDAKVVDLRDVKDFTVNPVQVKGIASGVQERLHGQRAAAIHAEVKSRAQGQKSGSNLATMSYAELVASLDEEAKQGLKQGQARRQKEADAKLRRAFQLPEDADEDLLDLILPPEPTKLTPLQQAMQQIKNEALRLLHSFDRAQNDEKERVFEAYQGWKLETGKLVSKVSQGQIKSKEYEDAYKLLDQRFLFSLTMIGKTAVEKEDAEIAAVLPTEKKGGAK